MQEAATSVAVSNQHTHSDDLGSPQVVEVPAVMASRPAIMARIRAGSSLQPCKLAYDELWAC